MKFLCWNVLAQPLVEGYQLDPSYNQRSNRVIQTLQRLPFDIAFLQEVTFPLRKKILESLLDYRIGPLAKHDQSGWPKWSRSEDYGNLTISRIDFSQETHYHSSGTAFDVCRFPFFRTVNVHLDSQDHRLRKSELRKALKLNPDIIAGDFNSDQLYLPGYQLRTPRETTCHDDGKMIDAIYLSRDLKAICSAVYPIPFEESGSDHYPIMVEC